MNDNKQLIIKKLVRNIPNIDANVSVIDVLMQKCEL